MNLIDHSHIQNLELILKENKYISARTKYTVDDKNVINRIFLDLYSF